MPINWNAIMHVLKMTQQMAPSSIGVFCRKWIGLPHTDSQDERGMQPWHLGKMPLLAGVCLTLQSCRKGICNGFHKGVNLDA